MTGRSWSGLLVATLSLSAAVGVSLHVAANRSVLEQGLLYPITSYIYALPLIGFGCALPQSGGRCSTAAALTFILGLALGGVGKAQLLSMVMGTAGAWRLFSLLTGPLPVVLAGATLLVVSRKRAWILQPAAFLLGSFFAVAIRLNDPTLDDPGFALAAVASTIGLVAAVALAWHKFERPWFAIGGRILGSWLMAVGLLLGGAMLAPRHDRAPLPPLPAASETDPAPRPDGSVPPEEFSPAQQP